MYLRAILSLLGPGGSAVNRMMKLVFADRLPLDHPVLKQLAVGARCLKPRLKVFPKVFSDSELARVCVPVYLLLGEKEVCYNPIAAARRARRVLRQGSVETLPSAGHLLVMERPDEVNERIRTFLRD